MRAIVHDTYGAPEEVMHLREVDQPAVADDAILLRVHAASTNPLDWHIVRGKPFLVRFSSGLRAPKQSIRGVDVSGTVEEAGSAVGSFQPGDEVFGFCSGAFAEYAIGRANQFVPKPANLTHEQAAAVPVAGITALQGLRDLGRLEAGHRVLIIGASGGVGTFAVQIAKSFDADVTAVCSTRNIDLVRSIGADDVIDYTTSKLSGTYDVVFQLAGTASPGKLRRLLTEDGTLVLSSGDGRLSGIDRIVKAVTTSRFVSQRLVTWITKENEADLAALADLMEAGRVIPVIDRTYGLEDVPEAIRYQEQGHTRGKVVITI